MLPLQVRAVQFSSPTASSRWLQFQFKFLNFPSKEMFSDHSSKVSSVDCKAFGNHHATILHRTKLLINLDPVVRRGDNFIPGINHAIPRINFIPGLNCVARSGDKFILGINRANPGIKLTQRFSNVKSLSRCFFVMKHYRKQFCRYTCFSNNINISTSVMRASFYHKERKI